MLPKYSTVIADTSCFILLDKIGKINLLQWIFKDVTTTPEIKAEFTKPLPEWVQIQPVHNRGYLNLLEMEIDRGEASAIALALENSQSLLILDDQKARKAAARLGLPYTGSLGIFLKAKEMGVIPSIRPLMDEIQKTNFRFSEKIVNDILAQANE